ncbi:MAG: bifunctional riboflavin kinase/FAD synthetase [Eubacteriales bacterium]|nr:bifunctional riboflavin kinase/FAD synthetase [Eubacteriales bacterium]
MIEKDAKRAIALGYFDGVHCGHQELMKLAVQRAKENGAVSSVFTFDVHPDTVITGQPVPLITSEARRGAEIRERGGVDEVIFARFNEELRNMDWKKFIDDILVGQFHACWIITGRNNRFGYRGQGTPERLQEECARLGVGCDIVESVKIDNIVVSSTYIRQQLAMGNMERAAEFLGHPYTIAGVVQHGRRVGRTLGYRTVNLELPQEMQAPPFGVYVSRVVADGAAHIAVTNIGVHPTFGLGDKACVEPHILDFDGDLYGKLIQVELLHFLRPERQFDNSGLLKQAIAADIEHTRKYFEVMKNK